MFMQFLIDVKVVQQSLIVAHGIWFYFQFYSQFQNRQIKMRNRVRIQLLLEYSILNSTFFYFLFKTHNHIRLKLPKASYIYGTSITTHETSRSRNKTFLVAVITDSRGDTRLSVDGYNLVKTFLVSKTPGIGKQMVVFSICYR